MNKEGFSSAPAARFIGYFSRKGRKGAKGAKLLFVSIAYCYRAKTEKKDAKGKKGVVVRRIIVVFSRFMLFDDNLANNNPSLSFLPFAFFAPLRPWREFFSEKVAPQAPASGRE